MSFWRRLISLVTAIASFFNKAYWVKATTVSRRNEMLKSAYLQGEKRLSRGCYYCHEDYANVPLRDIPGLDGHHIWEILKLFNPSEGASKPIHEARMEHRKCFPLCKCCHMRITYNKPSTYYFSTMMRRDGFRINYDIGIIYKTPDTIRIIRP